MMLSPSLTSNLDLIKNAACLFVVPSFNQPRFSPNASWNPNGTTFVSSNIIGGYPSALFINTNNTIFGLNRDSQNILIWRNASSNLMSIISANLSNPASVFVTANGEIFADGGSSTEGPVARWMSNGTRLSSFISFYDCSKCDGLFIDTKNNLYCSQQNLHQVVRKSLNYPSSTLSIVAGVGLAGSDDYMLTYPVGIFVTTMLDLYVADSYNHRVQLFRSGENNATTVAGNGSVGTIGLDCPSGVTLDGDGYLFIVDQNNNRVVASGPGGYHCVVGCSGSPGGASNELNHPMSMSFDFVGNIFVVDSYNYRIQKFLLSSDSFGK